MEKTISLAELPTGFYLIQSDRCTQDIFQQANPNIAKAIGIISKNFQLLPFLSIQENLLLGVKKNRQNSLTNYLTLVDLSPTVFYQSRESLSTLENIKLQLIRQLLQQKRIILLNRCYKDLSVKDIQWLLPFCHELSHSREIKIILFSTDRQLCETPYIDQVLSNMSS